MAIIARAIRTITDLFDPIQQGTAPASPVTGILWLDTALTPNQLKRWSGTAWVTVNDPTGILTRLNAAETKITDSAIVSTVRSSSEYLADLSGKNRTWLQTTAPVGAAVGDLWIDTANGNLLKRWNGSSWANVQDAAVSIAQQTANKISWIIASGTSASNMTLTSQLYSLVSQNVVINANNLTATARDTLKLEAVGAIQVGGTNLLVKANYNDRIVNVASNSLCGYAMQLRSGTQDTAEITGLVLKQNQDYTISFTYWANSGTQTWNVDLNPDDLPETNGTATTTPQHCKWTIKSSSANMLSCKLRFFPHPATPTDAVYFSDIKLEIGNVATDWSPSPLDPAVGVKTSYVTIDNDSIDIASGGSLNLSAASQITIGTKPMQVGGTNLVKNGAFDDAFTGWSATGWSHIPSDYRVFGHGLVYGTGTSPYINVLQTVFNISPSTQYTLSFYNSYHSGMCYYFLVEIRADGSATAVYRDNGSIISAAGWQSKTITTMADTGRIVVIVRALDTAYLKFSLVKLEKGNVATDWSPSPEDPASGVKTSYISIDNDSIDIASGGTLNLSAAGSIKIGTSPLSVGGTNLIPKSGNFTTAEGWSVWSPGGTTGVTANPQLLVVTNPETGAVLVSSTISHTFVLGKPYTISFYGGYIDCVAQVCDSNGEYNVIYFGQLSRASVGNGTFFYTATGTVTGVQNVPTLMIGFLAGFTGGVGFLRFKLEQGNVVTAWSPSPLDPAAGVKTSYINIDNDSIEITSGGSLTMTSPTTLAITSGSTNATAIAIRNDTNYFISAGHVTQSSAPFYVKKDGSFKAISGIIGGFAFTEDTFADSATLGNYMKIQPYAKQVWFGNMYIGQDGMVPGWFLMSPNMYCTGAVSALSFTDRTPIYTGNALAALAAVKDNGKGGIDHASLPPEARKTIQKKLMDEGGKPVLDANKRPVMFDEPGRDLGMMISVLTKAAQEIKERLEKLEGTSGQGV